MVVAKSPDNLSVIDKIIEGLDQPQSVGLPDVVELKQRVRGRTGRAVEHAAGEETGRWLRSIRCRIRTLGQRRHVEPVRRKRPDGDDKPERHHGASDNVRGQHRVLVAAFQTSDRQARRQSRT